MKYIAFISLFLVLIIVTAFSHFNLSDNFDSNIRLINEPSDKHTYFQRGMWYPLKKAPYIEVFSEYPQLATYFFALPHAWLSYYFGANYTGFDYAFVFSSLMMVLLFSAILILYLLKDKNKYLSYLMLLPASLYFTYNRYDMLPVLISIISFYFLSRERFKLSVFFLALGVLAKWYLVVLFPIFMIFYYNKYRKINYGMLATFCLVGIAGVLPTLLSDGIEAFLVPYKFHAARGFNREGLLYLLKSFFGGGLHIKISSKIWYLLFFMLQLAVIPVALISKIDSLKKVVNWSLLSVMFFMIFAKFYSPQWILWIYPFLILHAKNRKDVLLIIALDIATFLYFPIIFDGFPNLLDLIVIIKTAILLYICFGIVKEVAGDIDFKKLSFLRSRT